MTSPTESLEVLGDPTVVVDSLGSVTQANPSAEALLGWGRGELSGQPVEVLVSGFGF